MVLLPPEDTCWSEEKKKGVEELGWQGEKLENSTGRRWVLGKAVDETMHRESRIYVLDEQ